MARSDAEGNKQKILDAFKDLIHTDKQSAPPTMSDVIRHSGLGRGTVYRHYPDIGSLAFAVLNEDYQALFLKTRENLQIARDQPEILSVLEDHLRRGAKLTLANKTLLLADECRISAAYSRALESMRSIIGEVLQKYSGESRLTPRLAVYSDLIARCVEVDHLRDTANINDLNLSIEVAMDIIGKINSRKLTGSTD